LGSFVEAGGSLVIFPNKKVNLEEYNSLLAALNSKTIASFDTAIMGISTINYKHALYREVFKKQENEVDLPVIKGYTNFTDQMQNMETTLLTFRNGKNALTTHSFGKGTVYTFAFPLDQSNFKFISHVIFVPTVYNMVLNSGVPQDYSYSIENEDPIILNQSPNAGEVKIINSRTKDEFIIQVRTLGTGKKQLALDEITKEAGHFLINEGTQTIQSISYNYPREESQPDFFTSDDFKKLINSSQFKQIQLIETADSSFNETLKDLNNGKQLWKYFIILAILFLFCEMAIIQFWK
jgi:hypothetical protein